MIEIRPVVNIIGWLLLALGTIMLVPLAVDLWTLSLIHISEPTRPY